MQVGINQSPNRYYPMQKFPTTFQKGPHYFNPNNSFGPKSHVNQGQGNIEFDGKRLRKAVSRKTVDYNAVIVKYLEARSWQRDNRDRRAIQPDVGYYTEILPPMSMLENPVNSITTKFVRTSTNKMRCPIFCVVWTPEGRRLITGASSGEFTLWNGLTFNFETILQAHDSPVRCMVWSHNDTWMVTGDHSGYVKYWQSNMNNVKMFQAHKEPLRGISFCPTDTKFVTCSDDGTVRIWDFLRCSEEKILRGHGADVKCVAWHPQKSLIVSGSKDSQQPIKLWDPKSGTSLATIHAHKSTVMEVKWNQNGTWMLTASRDHLLKLFDIRNLSQEIQTFRGHKKEACSISWHPVHESMFVSGGSDGSVMFWVVGAEKEVGAMEQAHDSCVWSLAWHPLGHILCTGSNDHTSKFWTRNRPGDRMRDKYNLNTLPKGLDETNEYDDVSTGSLIIPGMGMEMIPGGPDQSPLGANSLSDLQSQMHKSATLSEGMMAAGIPGLDFSDDVNQNDKHELQQQQRKVPFSKPIPRQFQQQWMENKQPLLLAPPTIAQKDDKKNLGPPPGGAIPPGGEGGGPIEFQGLPNQMGGPMPMNIPPNQMAGPLNPLGPLNQMGPPNPMGGPPMGMQPNQMGGPPNQMHGPPNQMGMQMVGPQGQMVGPQGQMVGPQGQMMGPQGQMVGPQGQMMGPQGQMVGPPDQMVQNQGQMGGPPMQMVGPPNSMGNQGMPPMGPHQGQMMGNQHFQPRNSRTTFITSHPGHFNSQDPQQSGPGPGPQQNQNTRGPLLQHPGFQMNPQDEAEFGQQRNEEDHTFWSTRDGPHPNEQFNPNQHQQQQHQQQQHQQQQQQQQEDDMDEQEDFDERNTGGGMGQMNQQSMISFHTGGNFEGNFQQNREFDSSMDNDMRNGDNFNSGGGGPRKRQWNDGGGAMDGSFSSGNSGPRNYNMRGGRGSRGGRPFRRGGGGGYRGRGPRRGGF